MIQHAEWIMSVINSFEYVKDRVNARFTGDITDHDPFNFSFSKWCINPGDADHVSMSGTSRGGEQICNIYDYTFIIKDNVMDEVSETGAEWQPYPLHIGAPVQVCKGQSHYSGDT